VLGWFYVGLAFRHALRASELVDVRVEQLDLKAATIHIKRAKNGTPGIHGLQGDELRLIRALLREDPHTQFLFLSERKAPLLHWRRPEAHRTPWRSRWLHVSDPRAHAAILGRLRTGRPRRRHTDLAGIHGPPVDREHGHLHGRSRQARPEHLGEIARYDSVGFPIVYADQGIA
jgi:integrase